MIKECEIVLSFTLKRGQIYVKTYVYHQRI